MTLAVIAGAASATAQTATPAPQSSGPGVRFLSRTLFHLGVEKLSGDRRDFVWEGDIGGVIDFLDWGSGRATFVGNYQVVMGDELKAFDTNQGNYILGFSGSVRMGAAEVAGVFHHESRHLADRAKVLPVDWNMVGARLTHRGNAGALFLETEGQFLGVVQRTSVDYEWEADGRVRGDLILRPGVGVLLGMNLRVLGVTGAFGRGTQTGARAEGGIRFDGEVGAIELFVAGERRIDPALFEPGTMNFVMAGFRLLSR